MGRTRAPEAPRGGHRGSPSIGRAGSRAAGIPAGTGEDPHRRRIKHALHARPDVVHGDGTDLVIPEELCHPGVMGFFIDSSWSVPAVSQVGDRDT
jgi:hypothetical protein